MKESILLRQVVYIIKNGDVFQKKVLGQCVAEIHYAVARSNEPKNRKTYSDYKDRVEYVFNHGTNEQISSLIGCLLVQHHNVEVSRND